MHCAELFGTGLYTHSHSHRGVSMSVYTTSDYIKKEQIKVGDALVLTIAGHQREVVGKDKEAKNVWTLTFEECEERLILNKTNATILAEAFDSWEMDDWTGKQIELYNNPSVMFSGKKVGGLSVRAHKE